MFVRSKFKDYEVVFENDIHFFSELIQTKDAEFVVDKKVYELYEAQLSAIPKESLVLIEASEENKIIDTALNICEKITAIPAKRNATLISIGGGIIQDITGFVAKEFIGFLCLQRYWLHVIAVLEERPH